MRIVAVKAESWRESAAQFAQPLDGFLPAPVAADLELTLASDADFDLVSLLEIQGLDYHRGQTNRQAVPPFSYLHRITSGYTLR
jgi:hypothetical protein